VAGTARCRLQTYAVIDNGEAPAGVTWTAHHLEYGKSGRVSFEVTGHGEQRGRFETLLTGRHNVGNVLAAIAVAFDRGVQIEIIRRAVGSFAGVRRRQELRGIAGGVWVLDDYAHHPTAVRETLKGLRRRFPKRRIIAAYDPRSATSRRRTFQDEFVNAFAHADEVVVGKLYDPTKIPKEERFDAEKLALDLHRSGTKASYIPDIDALVKHVAGAAGAGDVVVALSSGRFDGCHDQLLAAIGAAVQPAPRTAGEAVRRLLDAVGPRPTTPPTPTSATTSCSRTSTAWSAPSRSRCWARRHPATWPPPRPPAARASDGSWPTWWCSGPATAASGASTCSPRPPATSSPPSSGSAWSIAPRCRPTSPAQRRSSGRPTRSSSRCASICEVRAGIGDGRGPGDAVGWGR
jgi:hypothetical protein